MEEMSGSVVRIDAEDERNPILLFEIEIKNPRDKRIVFTNIVSRVRTAPPMKLNIDLGRLIPMDAFMLINPRTSSTFTFYLEMDRRKLNYIEEARIDDVWLNIHMSTMFLELDDWSPSGVGGSSFSVTMEKYVNVIRIPESDWIKLRDKLGYGRARIVEVSEETYKLIEEYRSKLRAKSLDDAIHEAIRSALSAAGR
jgi:hypothetical protein